MAVPHRAARRHADEVMDASVMGPVTAPERQMSSAPSQGSMNKIADVVGSVREKGVRLWSENGQLHYRAPKGVLTDEEIEKLRLFRSQIVALLEMATGVATDERRTQSHLPSVRAPLAFSQLAHWNLYQLSGRRAIRQIASATRLHGQINLNILRMSVAEVVRRHDALRTRIVVLDGLPMQEIYESSDCDLEVEDLTELSESFRDVEVQRRIERLILEPIDVALGPLFGVQILRIRDDEHVLIVAMEHMISDMFSMTILLRDIFTAYMQALRGEASSLPEITTQFADYAAWQRHAQNAWIENHGAYWNEHLKGCQRLRFPEHKGVQTTTRSGWAKVSLQVGRDLKAQLGEWCRLARTTLVMCIFTAYVALVLRWCNAPESVIQYQSNGRVNPDIENTIGYFASALYLRIALLEDDRFVDLLKRVAEEYCRAYEHADSSYMSAQVPRPEFTRNTVFNWIVAGSKIDSFGLDRLDHSVMCSPVPFEHPMLTLTNLENDFEPCIAFSETEDEIICDVYFPANRFSVDTMERFGRNFLMILGVLRSQPELRVKDILLL